MYPRNAASPPRIAIGAVVQISDGAVQTTGCTVRVIEQGGAEGDGGGTTAYSTDGIVLYTPTQAETDQIAFILIAKKTGCIPVSQTIVTSASDVTGYAGVDWSKVNAPTTAQGLTGTTIAVTQKVDVETIKTQAVTAAAAVTFPTSIASPTNITAGTITTVTNLTNAPTSGDFTATMKTSIGTAVAASAVASVTGNVGGNLAGSVGSVTAAVTVGTNNDKTGYALSATGSAAMTEGYAALGAAGTLPQILYEIRALLAEKSISGTTLTAKKLDGSTQAATYTLDDATTPSAITRAS